MTGSTSTTRRGLRFDRVKPPPFDYVAPSTFEAALDLLASGGPDARLLAGGQSLLPALSLRLARPSLLVDLGRVPGLRGLRAPLEGGGVIAGAMTRHHDFETSELVRERLPLIHAAMPGIAHLPIRARGTIGGSLAHADPAGDWPALCVACDAQLVLRSQEGLRSVKAAGFATGFFSTVLREAEAIAEVMFPAWPRGRRWGLQKFSRRRGDFSIAAVAVTCDLDGGGRVEAARIVAYGAPDYPMLVEAAAQALVGERPSADLLRRAARLAAESVPVRSDLHASAALRSELVDTLTRRALEQALA